MMPGLSGCASLTPAALLSSLEVMEVHITPDQEAQLSDLAAKTGQGTDDLVREAVERLLVYNQWFKKQVRVGVDQLDRGEFIEEEEMDARVERMLQP
jgi:predicted transcriptional regulator